MFAYRLGRKYVIVYFAEHHECNIMWTQNDKDDAQGENNSQLMCITGDPHQWVTSDTAERRELVSLPGFVGHFAGFTFDYDQHTAYFSVSGQSQIKSFVLHSKDNSTNEQLTLHTVYDGTSGSVPGLAMDWIHGNLYWTDSRYNWIAMTSVRHRQPRDTTLMRLVVSENLDEPHAVVVHPARKYNHN